MIYYDTRILFFSLHCVVDYGMDMISGVLTNILIACNCRLKIYTQPIRCYMIVAQRFNSTRLKIKALISHLSDITDNS